MILQARGLHPCRGARGKRGGCAERACEAVTAMMDWAWIREGLPR